MRMHNTANAHLYTGVGGRFGKDILGVIKAQQGIRHISITFQYRIEPEL